MAYVRPRTVKLRLGRVDCRAGRCRERGKYSFRTVPTLKTQLGFPAAATGTANAKHAQSFLVVVAAFGRGAAADIDVMGRAGREPGLTLAVERRRDEETSWCPLPCQDRRR